MRLLKNILKDKNKYGNWLVYSPDNILMFGCGEKKANWYLSRNLAEVVDDKSIKLTFNPKGLGKNGVEWATSKMENRCVNCGDKSNLTKHHVVPISYRRFFPIDKKEHNHHDVLLMCVDCHEKYESKANILKTDISNRYGVPLNGIVMSDNDKEYIKIRKIISCLLGDVSKIPKERLDILKNELRSYFNWKNVTTKRLIQESEVNIKYHVKTHGELVVDKISDIDDFIKMWRRHFIENNDCNFLPKGWCVNNE